ncbi:ABC transporter substrate-binding protein [Cohnella sp. GCM10027633]|uniref:ABC transporter substrate-binding protein n=1 Tax=unclassified Cohnella TaxID=2636738 RepID=UPI00364046B6
MLKTKTVAVTMLTLTMLLAACGNNNANNESGASPSASAPAASGSASPSASAGEKVDLRMSWWGSDERHEKTQKAIELFESKNPGVTITPEYSGFDGYMDKLNTQIAAGNAPDLIQMGGNIKEYVDKSALLDLTPYVGSAIKLDDFNQGLVQSATFDGKLYGVTLGVNSTGLMYNAALFEKAGVTVPTKDWTYDDLKNAAIALQGKLGDGNYALYDLSSDSGAFASYLGAYGKKLYDVDGQRHFEKEDAIGWFQLWSDLRGAGAVVPADVQVANPPTAADTSLVVKGQVAIQSGSASQLAGLQQLTQDSLGLLLFPNGPAGSGMVPPLSGQYITAYEGTKHPEVVAKFIDFMVNDPEAGAILGNTRGVPPAGKIRDALAAQSTPVDKLMYDYISLVAEVAPPVVWVQFPLDNELIKLLQLTSEKIGFNAKSVDAAAEEFMTEIDKLIAKANAQ